MPKTFLVLRSNALAAALCRWLDPALFRVLPEENALDLIEGHDLKVDLLLIDGRQEKEDQRPKWSALKRATGVAVLVLTPDPEPLEGGVLYLPLSAETDFTSELAEAIIQVHASVAAFPRRLMISGELVLGLDSSSLALGEKVHPLTPKECRLLELFMSRAGQVLDRKILMHQVWDTDYTGDTRTIDVHICWLRDKIEPDPRHPTYLRTVRGMGYRFEVPRA